MSDLSDTARALSLLERDLTAVEKTMETHEQADNNRFLLARKDIMELEERDAKRARSVHDRMDFLEDYLKLVHDQMIDGFRKLGAAIEQRDPNEITPRIRKRDEKNGH
jgi:hypothetical protein